MITLPLEYDLRDLSATERFGTVLGTVLEHGGAVFLAGALGSGKTTLVRAIVRSLGGTDAVTSPTFDLLHLYRAGTLTVFHIDGYRLMTPDEWDVLDLPVPLAPDQVLLAEWAASVSGWYPDRLEVTLARDGESPGRRVQLMAYGDDWGGRVETAAREMQDGV